MAFLQQPRNLSPVMLSEAKDGAGRKQEASDLSC